MDPFELTPDRPPVMHCDALLSQDGHYRYSLTRRWEEFGQPIAWVMLNPSQANATKDDATIRRCIGFSRRWGYGSLVVVNLFPLIATDPAALRAAGEAGDMAQGENFGARNSAMLYRTLLSMHSVAAWGDSGGHVTQRVLHRYRALFSATSPLFCLGRTKAGNPRHPVRLPYSTELETLDGRQLMEELLCKNDVRR